MATYNVYMGQGIWIPDLRNNTLLTGAGGVSNRVQSCSAIVFFNTDTKGAGMYHFPAGNITEYKYSQQTIVSIANQVLSPIQITIAVGKLSKKTEYGEWLPAESNAVMNKALPS